MVSKKMAEWIPFQGDIQSAIAAGKYPGLNLD
jgi:hypothetical protein